MSQPTSAGDKSPRKRYTHPIYTKLQKGTPNPVLDQNKAASEEE